MFGRLAKGILTKRLRDLWCVLTQIHIDPAVWYIAVGLGHPGGAGAPKGWVVHPLKTYMSWVQNVKLGVAWPQGLEK